LVSSTTSGFVFVAICASCILGYFGFKLFMTQCVVMIITRRVMGVKQEVIRIFCPLSR
jgi:hypothetical protein